MTRGELQLQRLLNHYAIRFLMRAREPLGQPLDLEDARSRLQRLVRSRGRRRRPVTGRGEDPRVSRSS